MSWSGGHPAFLSAKTGSRLYIIFVNKNGSYQLPKTQGCRAPKLAKDNKQKTTVGELARPPTLAPLTPLPFPLLRPARC